MREIVIAHEPSDFVCERGHRLRKYYFTPSMIGHDLLCPHCDKEIIEQRTQRAIEQARRGDAAGVLDTPRRSAYTVTITFTVQPDTDEHLQHEQAIRDEVTSWLAGLNAVVQTVDVRVSDPERTS